MKTKVLTLFINREFSKLWGEEIAGPLDTAMKLKDSYSLVEVMTNLDSILKSRDITLPTKVSLVKAMVFPIVMYGCESWTVKKAQRRRIDAFERGVGEDS